MSHTLLLTNGRIHTMNPDQVMATAIVIRDGRIVAVGDDELLDWRGDGVDVYKRQSTTCATSRNTPPR